MDETKKPRNPNDLLIIQNVDTEDHEWQYDTVKTPLPYYLHAGETRKLPFYIAKHGVEKLIDKMLQKQNKLHTNPLLRDELRKRIVLGLEHINLVRDKTPNELLLEEMKRKKDIDPYEELLKEREIEAEKIRTQAILAAAPKAPVIETVGIRADAVIPTTTPIAPTENPLATNVNPIDMPIVDPERQEVYNLLQTKLHLDLTHQPTREKFDATPLTQLRQDFSSELPELVVSPEALLDTGDPLADALGAV